MRKELIVLAVSAALTTPLIGCGQQPASVQPQKQEVTQQDSSSSQESTKGKYALDDLVVPYSPEWTITNTDDGRGAYIYPTFGGLLYVTKNEGVAPAIEESEFIGEYFDGFEKNEGTKVDREAMQSYAGTSKKIPVYLAPMTTAVDGVSYRGIIELVCDWPNLYSIMFAVPEESFDGHAQDIFDVLDAIEYGEEKMVSLSDARKTMTQLTATQTAPQKENKDPQPEQTKKEEAKPEQTKEEKKPDQAKGTVSQQNALRSAERYLGYTSFSYNGLIDQLEFEGFSNEDATYAADNCGADWNEQAVKKAKQYLGYTSFSYSGLVQQLEYEGFSNEEATHGADSCGADWNEQAAKKAQQYLDYTSFSRDGLIDQLVYEGFSYEEAEYGVSSVGL